VKAQKIIFSLFIPVILFVCSLSVLNAQTKEYLWPGGAPDAKGDTPGDKPEITYFLPDKDKATGTAVLICPGGAYEALAMDYEGDYVAKWLNTFGVAGIVLKYRHAKSGAGYHNPVPLNDVQRAMSIVRGKAKELNINPDKIGVLGFSAGGHLAASLGIHYHFGKKNSDDPVERISCRPDFMILIYPVITMNFPYTHSGSRENLLGKNPEQSLVDIMSNELQVDPETPPTFLVHTTEDSTVPVENSLMFYSALRKAQVPVELHIFQKGGHGFGLGNVNGENAAWPELCKNWMKAMGFIN
jgi:acetyl esterase/lipase